MVDYRRVKSQVERVAAMFEMENRVLSRRDQHVVTGSRTAAVGAIVRYSPFCYNHS